MVDAFIAVWVDGQERSTAAAVANAADDATGIRIRELPLPPDTLLS